jgi:NACHT domain-containing protein
MPDPITDAAVSFGINLLSAITYDFAKGIAESKIKYFPNALLFSRDSMLELDKRISKFLENKRWQHSSHPVLYSYFKMEDASDVSRLRLLICSALFDEPYDVETCKSALLALQAKEIEKEIERVQRLKKGKKNPPKPELKNYNLDRVDVEEFNQENMTDLKKHIFEQDEISRLFISRLQGAPAAFNEQNMLVKPKDVNEDNRKLLLEYCKEIHSQVSSLLTSGIDAFLRQEQIENQLEASFVSLSLQDIWTDNAATFSENAEQIFQKFKYVIARGDAGSGKTTLLQWISLQCAKSMLGEPQSPESKGRWAETVPIFIPLRQIITTLKGKISVSDFVYLSTGSHDLARKVPVDWIDWVLLNQLTVCMFDGLDELPFQQRSGFWKFIVDFQKKFPLAKMIITSRNLSYTHTADGKYKNIFLGLQGIEWVVLRGHSGGDACGYRFS